MFEASIRSLEIDKSNKASWHFDSRTTKHNTGENNSLNDFEKKVAIGCFKLNGGYTHSMEGKGKPKFITFVEVEKVDEVLYVSSSPKAYF
jgi:hypothetical protein